MLEAQGQTMAAAFVTAHETVPAQLKPYLAPSASSGST